jgi:hypothetical protein
MAGPSSKTKDCETRKIEKKTARVERYLVM